MVALSSAVARVVDRPIGRLWPAMFAAVVATVSAVTVVLVSAGLAPSPRGDVERPFTWGSPAIALVVVIVVASWLVVEDHPASTVGLSLVAVAWLLPGLAAWLLLPAPVRAGLLAAAPLAAAGIALIVAGWRPTPADQRAQFLTAVRAAVGLSSAAAAAHLVGYDPFFDPACSRTCEASPAFLSSALGPQNALGVSASLTLAASIAAAVTSIRSRAASWNLRAAGLAAAMFVAAAAWVEWSRWGDVGATWVPDLLQSLGTGVIVSAVLAALLHTRRVRRNVGNVVEQLTGSAPVSGGGSVSAIHFAVPDDGRWVDAAGHLVTPAHPEGCAVLSDADGEAVRLVLGRWADAGHVLGSITPAGRLALENARLQAAGLVRVADVQASQRRIVAATDLERRRIERDLHDGAQQRLVAVRMQLSSARTHFRAISEVLSEGEAHVRDALDMLRDLSHDSFAEVLDADGLAAAVEELVVTLPLRVDVDIQLSERQLPPAVQMAAYVTVAAALDNVAMHARTDHAQVTLVEEHDELIVRVADDGRGGAVTGRGLTDVADRVGSLGGSLDVASRPGEGTTVMARLPCV